MNNDGFATSFRIGFYFSTGTDINFATAGTVSFFDTTATVDDRSRREVWPRDVFHQPFNADVFIFNIRQTAVDHLGEVMRRNVGCHTHSDTRRAVNQQVGNARWHNRRNLFCAVIVWHEIDSFFF
ncbi:hypothetical protein SRABI106_04707 [Rahnella aquatilis]|nr:hypothetical protein SRABI106_04707 [Rahnella aquatilis]